jgi:hypothetical protein
MFKTTIENELFDPRTTHKPFIAAYRKGWYAAKAGRTIWDNPYDDTKQANNNFDSWGAQFCKYWYSGFHDATEDMRIKMETLGEAFAKEQARLRDLLIMYKELGPRGEFGAIKIESCLKRADQAAIEGDVVAMLRIYEEMLTFK